MTATGVLALAMLSSHLLKSVPKPSPLYSSYLVQHWRRCSFILHNSLFRTARYTSLKRPALEATHAAYANL